MKTNSVILRQTMLLMIKNHITKVLDRVLPMHFYCKFPLITDIFFFYKVKKQLSNSIFLYSIVLRKLPT